MHDDHLDAMRYIFKKENKNMGFAEKLKENCKDHHWCNYCPLALRDTAECMLEIAPADYTDEHISAINKFVDGDPNVSKKCNPCKANEDSHEHMQMLIDIEVLKDQIKDRDKMIFNLEQQVSDRRNEIVNLKEKCKELDKMINILTDEQNVAEENWSFWEKKYLKLKEKFNKIKEVVNDD